MPIRNDKVAGLRQDYTLGSLSEGEVSAEPFSQFDAWFKAAGEAGVREPNTMTLATVSADGKPSARVVLLKGYGSDGFVFYTNHQSRKGRQMRENPYVALVFQWAEMERQVRIEGRVEPLGDELSDRYYQSRPRGSRLGAWASPQSRGIPSRQPLEGNMERLERHFDGREDIPRPPFWGGYRVVPERVEFWQGRASRLHDRILYTPAERGGWQMERLAP